MLSSRTVGGGPAERRDVATRTRTPADTADTGTYLDVEALSEVEVVRPSRSPDGVAWKQLWFIRTMRGKRSGAIRGDLVHSLLLGIGQGGRDENQSSGGGPCVSL